MKNSRQYILLALLLLAVVTLLSSCYIAPDDINGYGYNPSETNNLPFQTLAPTATVTPEETKVPVQTQNIFGIETPVPSTDPWGVLVTGMAPSQTIPVVTNSIATIPVVTSSNQGGTVVFLTPIPEGVTPTPTQPPLVVITPASVNTNASGNSNTSSNPSATPEPKSMQLGFTGLDVRLVQKRLQELGYYTGSIDGDFGLSTDKAVKAFQKANGLTADGKIGPKTKEILDSSKAITAKQAAAGASAKTTAQAKATATPDLSRDYYLQMGSAGTKVRTLQQRLIQLGWMQGKATGTFDAATQAAVKAFQKKADLWDDGVAGPGTLKVLYSDKAPKTSTAASSTGETLEMGMEGTAVRALQNQLKKLGYLKGSVDGSFGEATRSAVVAFQQNNGLTADGKAGTATLNKLYSENARSADASPSGDNGSSSIASTGYVTLEDGSNGDAVRKLQSKLKELGYYSGNVDGSYGEGTVVAVENFQKKHDLRVDGKAGPATQRVLYGSSATINYNTLELGSNGTPVSNLQYTLYELGYYDDSVDGYYGKTTADAVRAFQIQNKLTPVDGKAGNKTLQKLYSSTAIPAAANITMDTIRPGAKSDTVLELREILMQHGYLTTVNSRYDDEMTQAVKEFQKDHGLEPDGVIGPRTLKLLLE